MTRTSTRAALVLSPEAFNRFGMALACPVTGGGGFARGLAWTVPLAGAGLVTDGVVLCNQVRTVDWQARRARFIEAVPAQCIAGAFLQPARHPPRAQAPRFPSFNESGQKGCRAGGLTAKNPDKSARGH